MIFLLTRFILENARVTKCCRNGLYCTQINKVIGVIDQDPSTDHASVSNDELVTIEPRTGDFKITAIYTKTSKRYKSSNFPH